MKHGSVYKKMLIAAVLLITVAIIQHLVLDLLGVEARQDMVMTDTGIGVSYGFDMHAAFYSPSGRNFFFATRDGVQNLTSSGELRWQYGFNMVLPQVVGRGEFLAIGEEYHIYVFGPDGMLYTVSLQNPALYYTVNATGHLSVITRTNTGYHVKVFNPTNQREYYRASINDPNVFPFSVDASNCGTYIVKALVDVNTLVFSRLIFGYLSEHDPRSRAVVDGHFDFHRLPDEFIVRARFTDCGRVIVLTDRRIIGFRPGEDLLWDITLTNRPEHFYIGDNGFSYVTGDAFLNLDAADPGVLRIYNFDGQPTGTYDLGRRATHLSMGHNAVLVGMGRTFYAINMHGTRLWTYSAFKDVQDKIFLDNTDTVLLAGGNRATVMRRLRVN